MTETELALRCQLGECRNLAAVTVTVELPTDWSESRTYNVVTLQVAACGECARDLEGHGNTLLAARVRFARQQGTEAHAGRLATELVALIEAVGPPFEPVQGSVFATWLTKLDKPLAQGAWRLLAHVKRQLGPPGRKEAEEWVRRSLAGATEIGTRWRYSRIVQVPGGILLSVLKGF